MWGIDLRVSRVKALTPWKGSYDQPRQHITPGHEGRGVGSMGESLHPPHYDYHLI